MARKKYGIDIGDYRVVWQFRSRLEREESNRQVQ